MHREVLPSFSCGKRIQILMPVNIAKQFTHSVEIRMTQVILRSGFTGSL